MSRVMVAGSINMDVVARVRSFPRPGETVLGGDLRFLPGGKGANQAVAAQRSGSAVALIGRVGGDAFGDQLRAFLSEERIDVSAVATSTSEPTGAALILVDDSGENSIVVVGGANHEVSPSEVSGVAIDSGDVLVCQNEIPADTIAAFFRRGSANGALTVFNPAPALEGRAQLLELADVIVLNESEAEALYPSGPHRRRDGQVVVVTRGARGVIASGPEGEVSVAGHDVHAVDTTGAGDCFVGAMASRLARGDPVDAAIRFANAAASVAVQSHGAGPSMPTLQAIEQALR